jgi:hypothetical protein
VKRTHWKKTVAMVIGGVLLLLVLTVANALGGNPVSKALVRQRVLSYYRGAYQEEFIVYAGGYNMKIPAYVFEMGPKARGEIRFSTALYTMGISDEYGGILAGAVLAEDLQRIISEEFPASTFTIEAREDPLTEYPNEKPEYFQTDPLRRLGSNHFTVWIHWTAPGSVPDNFRSQLAEMAFLASHLLPYTTPNLVLIGVVHGPEGNVLWTDQTDLIFPSF